VIPPDHFDVADHPPGTPKVGKLELISMLLQRDADQLTSGAHAGLGKELLESCFLPNSRMPRFCPQFPYWLNLKYTRKNLPFSVRELCTF
jgi:hypothetical protein